MKTLLLLILPLFFASCVWNDYEARSVTGNYVKETTRQLGGTRSSHRSDGSSDANDLQVSFRDGAEAVVATAGLVVGGLNVKSDNALKETQGKQETARQLGARQPTIVPAQAVKPDTTVFPLVVPPVKQSVP